MSSYYFSVFDRDLYHSSLNIKINVLLRIQRMGAEGGRGGVNSIRSHLHINTVREGGFHADFSTPCPDLVGDSQRGTEIVRY